MNRKKYYSENETNKIQYKVTAFPINSCQTKDEMKEMLRPKAYKDIIKNVNLARKAKKDFLQNNILSIGNIKDKMKVLNAENISHADFIFIDFEEPKNNSNLSTNQRVLDFDECLKILNENKLNYILATSYSHTKNKPRLHLLIALFKPIKDAETYTYNWQLIVDKFFQDYYVDTACKNITRWIFPSNKNDDMKCKIEFSQNDFEAQKIDKKLLGYKQKLAKQKNKSSTSVTPQAIVLFSQQIKNLYGFDYDHTDSNGVLKFSRDENDKIANIWYAPEFYNHNNNLLFDHDEKFSVLFTPEHFERAISNPKLQRLAIQKELREELDLYFQSPKKKYIVTNEGLGKSTTILKYAEYNDFLFCCATKDRVLEVSETLTENSIPHYVVLSNQEILKKNNQEALIPLYEQYIAKKKKLGLKSFLNAPSTKKFFNDPIVKAQILRDYDENLEKMKDKNMVRICTTKKLQVEILKAQATKNDWYITHQIIFDEFSLHEWALHKEAENGAQTIPVITIWNKPNSYISLELNEESFLTLLKPCKKVLILTTERPTIEIIMYGREYSEIIHFKELQNKSLTIGEDISYNLFEKQLLDKDIHYFLCSSTKVGTRDKVIETIRQHYKNFIVISNNAKDRDYSHERVKGSNLYQNKDIAIIGTLRTEMEDNILYYSGKTFFEKLKTKYKNKHTNTDAYIRNYIKIVQLTTQVSQSIGRNSGFRRNGTKTLVVLPILENNSKRRFAQIPLQYISPNVYIVDHKRNTKIS